jgi:co-chaperonin GroES (HSP10)
MTLQAIHDTVIVKPLYEETNGNIVIPPSARAYKQLHGQIIGQVISVGPRYKYNLQPGQMISFQRNEGQRFIVDGETYLKLRSRWIMGVVENA